MTQDEEEIIAKTANNNTLLDDIEREACTANFFDFVVSFWETIIPEVPVYNWHIPYLCQELQQLSYYIINRLPKPYDLIINIPPGTTKSTIVTEMFPAWLWVKDPTLRIISSSYAADISVDQSQKSKDIITSEKYQRLFPYVKIRHDMSGKGIYGNTKGGERYVTSTGSSITGKHAHVIINDDPQNPKQANSEPLRLQANEFTKTLSTRKVNKKNTPIITIMQRLHEADVTGFLLSRKKKNIKHICLPAELSDNVKPAELKQRYINGLLDPVRLDRVVLDEAMIDLGSTGYAGQYSQQPASAEGNIVQEKWFSKISLSQFYAIRSQEPINFYLDTAYREKDTKADNDPSGIIAVCKINNFLYVVHAKKVWKNFPDLLRFLTEYCKTWGFDKRRSTLRIEPKANGISVVQQLKENTDLNVTETPSPKDSKATRLKTCSPKIECGRVVLVEGEWNQDFIDEICKFPTMVHDEYVDILGYAIDKELNHEIKIPRGFSKANFSGIL